MSPLPLPVQVLEFAAGLTELGIAWFVQSTFILAADLAAGWLIASRGPALQSALYRTTLVAVAACPIVAWLLSSTGAVTGFSVSALDVLVLDDGLASAADAVSVASTNTEAIEQAANRAFDTRPPVDSRLSQRIGPEGLNEFNHLSSDPNIEVNSTASVAGNLPLDKSIASPAPEADEVRAPPAWSIRTSMAVFVVTISMIWLGGSLVLLARLAIGIRRMTHLCREATAAQPQEQALCDKLAASLGVRPPHLLRTPFLDSPCLAGTVQPVILLPEEPLRLSLSAVLTHELAHLKRGDHRWNLAAQTVLAILFFQPLLWRLVRRLEIAAEEVCDDHVVNFGADRTRYADGLLALAEHSAPSLVTVGVPLVTLRSLLARRVRRILDHCGSPSLRVGRKAMLAVYCLGLLVTTLGGLVAPNGDSTAFVAAASAGDDAAAQTKQDSTPKTKNDPEIDKATKSSDTTEPTEKATGEDTLPRGAIARLGTTRFRPWRTVDGVEGVSFLPDNRTLALTTFEGWLEHWDAESGRFLREVQISKPYASQAVHTSDGRFVVAKGFDGERRTAKQWVALFNAQSGQERMRLDIDGSGRALVVSADGTTVAVRDGKKINVIDVEKKEIRHQLDEVNLAGVEATALSDDGELLLVGSPGQIRLWNLATGEAPRSIAIAGRDTRSKPSIEAIAFSPDGSRAAIGNHQTGVSLVDLLRGKVVREFSIEGPESWRSLDVVFSPDGQIVAAPIEMYYGGGVAIWDVKSGALLKRLESGTCGIKHLAFSHDGQLLAGTSFEPILCVWNVASGERFGRSLQGHTDAPSLLRFLPGDERLATASDDGTVHLWDINSSKLQRVIAHEPDAKGYTRMIRGMAVSNDGRYIASSCLDDTVRVWEADTGREVHRVKGHGNLGGRRSVRFTPDNKRLVSWGDDMYLRTLELDTGTGTNELLNPTGIIDEVLRAGGARDPFGAPGDSLRLEDGLFSPDASRLVVLLKAVHVFDVDSRREILTFERAAGDSNLDMAISPNNEYLLSAWWTRAKPIRGPDARRLELRRLADGKVLSEIRLAPGRWGTVAFSHDSRRAAVTVGYDQDCQVLILNVPELKEIGRIEGIRGCPRAIEFSNSGRRLAVSTADTSTVVFDLEKVIAP
jgi:WD40 repeat protein/beta-lactamase regulating signal transducer with metallopeptidase domain